MSDHFAADVHKGELFMAHRTLKSGYQHFSERINRFPQGAPPTESLFKILKVLMSEKEAELMSKLPIKPFTLETASKVLKLDLKEKLYQGIN